MILKSIKSEQDYRLALAMVDKLFNCEEDSPEMEELDFLCYLIEKWEDRTFPTFPSDPIGAIKFRMEQMGYTNSDLAKVLGAQSRVSEILNGTRKLSLKMIRALHEQMYIPTDILIKAY